MGWSRELKLGIPDTLQLHLAMLSSCTERSRPLGKTLARLMNFDESVKTYISIVPAREGPTTRQGPTHLHTPEGVSGARVRLF